MVPCNASIRIDVIRAFVLGKKHCLGLEIMSMTATNHMSVNTCNLSPFWAERSLSKPWINSLLGTICIDAIRSLAQCVRSCTICVRISHVLYSHMRTFESHANAFRNASCTLSHKLCMHMGATFVYNSHPLPRQCVNLKHMRSHAKRIPVSYENLCLSGIVPIMAWYFILVYMLHWCH